GDGGCLSVTRVPGDPDLGVVDVGIGFEVIEQPAGSPSPGSQRAPIIHAARLALVHQSDDPACETGAVIRLDAVRRDHGEAPALLEQLLLPGGLLRALRLL